MKSQIRTPLYYETLLKNGYAFKESKQEEVSNYVFDPTFGSKTLTSIGQKYLDSMDMPEKIDYLLLIENFRKTKTDPFIQWFCQYNRNSVESGDAVWWSRILYMMQKGWLYLSIINLKSWAHPDARKNENENNLKESININIGKGINSDGTFSINEKLEFLKVYPFGEIPEDDGDIEFIELDGVGGYIEYGTQDICKSAMTLMQGAPLLRVPYAINDLDPMAVLFINTNPKFFYDTLKISA